MVSLLSMAGQVIQFSHLIEDIMIIIIRMLIIIEHGDIAFDDCGDGDHPGFGADDEQEAKKKTGNSFGEFQPIRKLLNAGQKHQNWS